MDSVRLGRTGLHVSRLALGGVPFGYQCDEAASFRILDAAREAGIAFFDTADIYPLAPPEARVAGSSEAILGKWMRGRRHEVIIATKGGGPLSRRPWDRSGSRKHLMDAVEGSLRRLGTDYIDLYQPHHWFDDVPLDETLRALEDIVRSGKARYVGCSNYLAYRLARALGRSEKLGIVRFATVQTRYNLLFREIERELLPLCAEEGIGVLGYNAVAAGLLSGKHRREGPEAGTRFTIGEANFDRRTYWQEAMLDSVDELSAFAAEVGTPLAQLAIGWVLANPIGIVPIVGVSRPEQLTPWLAALEQPLPADVKRRLDELTSHYRQGDHDR
jgi:aryl-alcohol dehydrogenase (NADP+)